MQRIDRLLLKAQQAHQSGTLQVNVAFAQPIKDKWQAIIDLWDGMQHGETQRLIIECDTEAEALETIEKVKAEHKPKKYGSKKLEGITIIDNIENMDDTTS